MNCKECGHALDAGIKFCLECGAKQEFKCSSCGANLRQEAKFCGDCGTKVQIQSSHVNTTIKCIEISPSAIDLPEPKIEITAFEAEGPDEMDAFRVNISFSITNDTEQNWDYLECQTHLLTASGQIIEYTTDKYEQTVSSGETTELQTTLWGVKSKLLGNNPEQAHVLISATASISTRQELGEVQIPETPYETVTLKPQKIGNTVQIISGSLWKTTPDADGDCKVQLLVVLQNLTQYHLPEVKVLAEIVDRKGSEVTDATSYDQLNPGSMVSISGGAYGINKQFVAIKIKNLTVSAFTPVASGFAQKQGIEIQLVEQKEDDREDGSDDSKFWSEDTNGFIALSLNAEPLAFAHMQDSFLKEKDSKATDTNDAFRKFVKEEIEGLRVTFESTTDNFYYFRLSPSDITPITFFLVSNCFGLFFHLDNNSDFDNTISEVFWDSDDVADYILKIKRDKSFEEICDVRIDIIRFVPFSHQGISINMSDFPDFPEPLDDDDDDMLGNDISAAMSAEVSCSLGVYLGEFPNVKFQMFSDGTYDGEEGVLTCDEDEFTFEVNKNINSVLKRII